MQMVRDSFRAYEPINEVLPMTMKLVSCSLVFFALISGCSTIEIKPRNVSWKLYPDPRLSLTKAGEEIVFSITPSLKAKPFTVHYGDGQSQAIGEESITCFTDHQCKPLHFGHSYTVGRAYYPYITYSDDESTRIPANRNELKIIIARSDMKSDKEIENLAIENFSNQLTSYLREYCSKPNELKDGCGQGDANFAVGFLADANFDQSRSSQKIFTAAKDLTLNMLNNGFNVLEKNPQALTRLAYEAIVESEDEKGERIIYEKGRELAHLSHIEYSLQGRPGQRKVELEGTNDKEVIERASVSAASNSNSSGKESQTSTSLTEKTANEVLEGTERARQGNTAKTNITKLSKRKRVSESE